MSETNDEWDADSDDDSANKTMLFPPRAPKQSSSRKAQSKTSASAETSIVTPSNEISYPKIASSKSGGDQIDEGTISSSDIGSSALDSQGNGVRNDVEILAHGRIRLVHLTKVDLVDPFELLKRAEAPSTDFSSLTGKELDKQNAAISRFKKFQAILQRPNVDLGE